LISAGDPPQTPLGRLQRSPKPLAGFMGPTSKGREEKRGKREGRKRGRKGKGKREKGGERKGPPQIIWHRIARV